MVRKLRLTNPQTVEPSISASKPGSQTGVVDPRAAGWLRIVTRLNEIRRLHDKDQWEIGHLVSEAVGVGAPGTKSGAERAIRVLADQTSYELATLNAYRKTYTAWLDAKGKLDIVDGVSFGAHQAATSHEDGRGLVKALVDQVGGDPTRVTVAMTKAASRDEAVKRLAAQPKPAPDEPYTPINQHLAAIVECIKQIDEVLDRLGAPAFEAQRAELVKQTTRAIDRLTAHRRRYRNPSKDALAARLLTNSGNPYVAEPEARRTYAKEVAAAAPTLEDRSRYSNIGTSAPEAGAVEAVTQIAAVEDWALFELPAIETSLNRSVAPDPHKRDVGGLLSDDFGTS